MSHREPHAGLRPTFDTAPEMTDRTGMIGDDRLRWAEALAIERLHGPDAPRWIAARVGALAEAGDMAGVARFREIARRYDRLMAGTGDGVTIRS